MTDLNTAMMRDVFKWISKYEIPPVGPNEKWWTGLVTEGADIYNRYPSPLTRNIIYGVIDGQEQQYKINMINAEAARMSAGEQVSFDTTWGGANG